MTSGPVPAYPGLKSSILTVRPRRALAMIAGAASLLCVVPPPPFAAARKPVIAEKADTAGKQITCTTPSEDLIARQFDRFNRALATGNPDTVAQLYAPDAVLRVIGQPNSIIGRPAIRAYFAEFLARRPQGALSKRAINVSCNAASDTGTYVYRLTGQRKGTRTLISGRYSTFYEYRDGDWLIIRHHG